MMIYNSYHLKMIPERGPQTGVYQKIILKNARRRRRKIFNLVPRLRYQAPTPTTANLDFVANLYLG